MFLLADSTTVAGMRIEAREIAEAEAERRFSGARPAR